MKVVITNPGRELTIVINRLGDFPSRIIKNRMKFVSKRTVKPKKKLKGKGTACTLVACTYD